MANTCEVRQVETQPTVAVRTRTSIENLSQVIGKAYDDIMAYLGTSPGTYPDTTAYVAYHNMDMQNLDVEIGYVVRQALPGSGHIQPSSIIGGEYAVCLHRGAYDDLPKTYDVLMKWVGEHSYATMFPHYEFYLNAPGEVAIPDELETDVALRLQGTA